LLRVIDELGKLLVLSISVSMFEFETARVRLWATTNLFFSCWIKSVKAENKEHLTDGKALLKMKS